MCSTASTKIQLIKILSKINTSCNITQICKSGLGIRRQDSSLLFFWQNQQRFKWSVTKLTPKQSTIVKLIQTSICHATFSALFRMRRLSMKDVKRNGASVLNKKSCLCWLHRNGKSCLYIHTRIFWTLLCCHRCGLNTSKVFFRQSQATGMHSATQMSKQAGTIWFISWSGYLIQSYNWTFTHSTFPFVVL